MPAIIAAMKNDILDIPNTFYFPTWKDALTFYQNCSEHLIVECNATLPEDLEW